MSTRLMPRQPVPPLTVELVGGGTWTLGIPQPDRFTLLVFYRGLHCPICSRQLAELERLLPEFHKRGVTPIAISSDSQERAETARENWGIDMLPVGFGLSAEDAVRWGLHLSSGRGKTSVGLQEPALFSEPAIYLVRADGTLYYGAVQTMPFARPSLAELLQAIDFAISRDYPARGEMTLPIVRAAE